MTSKEKEFVDVRDAVETVQRHLHLIVLQNSSLKFLSEAKEKKSLVLISIENCLNKLNSIINDID